jgi:hypothetical protein
MKTLPVRLLIGLCILLASTLAMAADEALDAKIKEQVQIIEMKFKPQWAIESNEDVYDMPAAEMKAMTNTLDNLCKQRMIQRVQNDPSLGNMKFPLSFNTKIPRGVSTLSYTEGDQKYTELSKKTEYYTVTGAVKLTDCQTTCDKKEVKVSGQVHKIPGKCISKPTAILDGDPIIVHTRDVYEFTGISGWKP